MGSCASPNTTRANAAARDPAEDEAVRSEFVLQPSNYQRAADGANADRREKDAVKLRALGHQMARQQRAAAPDRRWLKERTQAHAQSVAPK